MPSLNHRLARERESAGSGAAGAPELVRIAVLGGYTTVATRLGLDYRPLIRAAGLTASLMRYPEQRVAARPVIGLIEQSARITGCHTFGLQMMLERTIADMGMISVLVALQPTLASAIDIVDRYRNLLLPIIALNLERHGDIAVVGLDIALASTEPHRQVNDMLLGAGVLAGRAILGENWAPHCTHFTYPEPAAADLQDYRRMFRSRLEFNAAFNGLTVSTADLDTPREGANEALADHAEALVLGALNPLDPNIVCTVQETILYLLGSSQATLEKTAGALGLQPRTLQRRLENEGYSFRGLVIQTRKQLAERLIANPTGKIADIAEALGYSSTGAFSRWYRRTFGRSPTDQR